MVFTGIGVSSEIETASRKYNADLRNVSAYLEEQIQRVSAMRSNAFNLGVVRVSLATPPVSITTFD